MFPLKALSPEAIPSALSKAERYRLLSEPWQAESICRDICAVQPDHQEARVMLILALTDQFAEGIQAQEALDLARELRGEYERAYYSGIVHERRAVALWRRADFRAHDAVHPLLEYAMQCYESAANLRPRGNDDAILRWNSCVRFLRRIPSLAQSRDRDELVLQE